MSRLRAILSTIALSAALAFIGAHATQVSMAGGGVTFATPDAWLGIMETSGDPEARVFQVPDPSPTGKNSLARVTVTVKRVNGAADFRQYINDAATRAAALPAYKGEAPAADATQLAYTAEESGVPAVYTEQYWLKNGLAIQLRCVRPAQSQAGTTWKASFDKGCASIAAQLQ
ncbi:MAG: hypothetical protein ABI300_11500 [Rhodanobacter sp.]